MGFANYDLGDGHGPRGYAVEAKCKKCGADIDKGIAFLCYACTDYFCDLCLHYAFDGDGEPVKFDCFAGQSAQCCEACGSEAESHNKEPSA